MILLINLGAEEQLFNSLYLLFEGANVVLTMRYTAGSVADLVATVEGYSQSQGLLPLFDVWSEIASEWAMLTTAAGSGSGSSSSFPDSAPRTVVAGSREAWVQRHARWGAAHGWPGGGAEREQVRDG
jgi:hypothetical protein